MLLQTFKEGFAVHGLDFTTLDLIGTAIEHAAHSGKLLEKAGHRALDKRICCASGLRGQRVQLDFDVRNGVDRLASEGHLWGKPMSSAAVMFSCYHWTAETILASVVRGEYARQRSNTLIESVSMSHMKG